MLRASRGEVRAFDEDLRRMANDMLETMYEANGIGLAAQQVGSTTPVCVLDVPPQADLDAEGEPLNPDVPMPLVLVDPTIVEASDDRENGEEGCLSFPDIVLPVRRAAEIAVRYRDVDGAEKALEARGLLARAIQHEIDHLDGVLFIDHVPPVKKISISGRLKRLRRETEQGLSAEALQG